LLLCCCAAVLKTASGQSEATKRTRRKKKKKKKKEGKMSDANTYLYTQWVQLINPIQSNQINACCLLACLLACYYFFLTCTGTRTEGTNWSIEPILALALSIERQTPPFLSLGRKNW
jgi:hypothetical protein